MLGNRSECLERRGPSIAKSETSILAKIPPKDGIDADFWHFLDPESSNIGGSSVENAVHDRA